jgi:prefoldin subunit 5
MDIEVIVKNFNKISIFINNVNKKIIDFEKRIQKLESKYDKTIHIMNQNISSINKRMNDEAKN